MNELTTCHRSPELSAQHAETTRAHFTGQVATSMRELRRLRIVRNFLTKTNPRLRTGCPDVQHRLKLRMIVQRGKADGHNSWSSFATRE
jgi:hypothetical protein